MSKINLYTTEAAWTALKQMGYDQGYVRGVRADDKARGMSQFIMMLCMHKWEDSRPAYMRGTDQWMTGDERVHQRCLSLSNACVADLGLIALEHSIYPYRTQLVVANGYRREMALPVLHAPGATPRGSSSVMALAGPVLEAIGLGYLTPVHKLSQAPPNLYQRPSQRYSARARHRMANRTVM